MPGHSIVVVGASAGGLAPLKEILGSLSPDLAASVFVVVHIPSRLPGNFLSGLRKGCRLELDWARDGETIRPGRVYVAPPDRHLLVKRGCVRVLFGAQENRVRPAVDVLFRSAAVAYGSCVVGVVLSGYQEDGAAGLSMIKRCGGVAVVLDPTTAEVPSMPLAALDRTPAADFVLAAAAIPGVIEQLASAEPQFQPPIPDNISMEAEAAERAMTQGKESPQVGSPTTLVCPDCGGMLREVENGPKRFRCRVGHTFTTAHLLQAMDEEVERALWMAARTLKERAELLKKLAVQSGPLNAETFGERAEEVDRQSQLLEGVLAGLMTARRAKNDVAEPPIDDAGLPEAV